MRCGGVDEEEAMDNDLIEATPRSDSSCLLFRVEYALLGTAWYKLMRSPKAQIFAFAPWDQNTKPSTLSKDGHPEAQTLRLRALDSGKDPVPYQQLLLLDLSTQSRIILRTRCDSPVHPISAVRGFEFGQFQHFGWLSHVGRGEGQLSEVSRSSSSIAYRV